MEGRRPIFCPECNSREGWRIEIERKEKKQILITIICKCGYTKQYKGVGESVE